MYPIKHPGILCLPLGGYQQLERAILAPISGKAAIIFSSTSFLHPPRESEHLREWQRRVREKTLSKSYGLRTRLSWPWRLEDDHYIGNEIELYNLTRLFILKNIQEPQYVKEHVREIA